MKYFMVDTEMAADLYIVEDLSLVHLDSQA